MLKIVYLTMAQQVIVLVIVWLVSMMELLVPLFLL